MNPRLIHTLILAAGILAAGLPQIEGKFPPAAAPWLTGAAAVFALVGAVLGVLDPPQTSILARRKP